MPQTGQTGQSGCVTQGGMGSRKTPTSNVERHNLQLSTFNLQLEAEPLQTATGSGFSRVSRGWTSGTEGPRACLKLTLDRSSSVPKQRSASGKTTLKFLPM